MVDLRQLVLTALAMVSGALLMAAFNLWRSGDPARRRAAGMCLLLALATTSLVYMYDFGLWRRHGPRPFPMHVLDLNAPPAEVERGNSQP